MHPATVAGQRPAVHLAPVRSRFRDHEAEHNHEYDYFAICRHDFLLEHSSEQTILAGVHVGIIRLG